MAKAKPAQTPEVETPVVPVAVTQDAPEVTQPVTTEVQTTSEQPTETTEAPAQVAQTDTATDAPVVPEVSSLDSITQDEVGDKYVREDGVQVTVLPGGTVREDY